MGFLSTVNFDTFVLHHIFPLFFTRHFVGFNRRLSFVEGGSTHFYKDKWSEKMCVGIQASIGYELLADIVWDCL